MERCQPLYCDLCSASFGAPTQAKMHYQGKIHDKHVRGFFMKVGLSQAKIPQKMDRYGKFPRVLEYKCTVCDLEFTSAPSLQQHLAGKNHLKKAAGESVKATFNKKTKQWENTTASTKLSPPSPDQAKQIETANTFYCDICKVGAPSQEQLDMHLNGKNHKKKMGKSMGGVDNNDLETIQKRMQFKESVMQKLQKKPRNEIFAKRIARPDYSIYRTPSGCYYCTHCNITVNNEAQFEQHNLSKKHKQKEIVSKARR